MSRRLAEVAAKVGVSEATVSRVLNGKPGVSEATRAAVLTALDVMGYERPVKLRGERGRLVGLVLPELVNPIFPAFAEVVGGALAQQGYTPVLCTRSAGGVSEAEYVDLLLAQQVSGVIFAGGFYAERGKDHAHYRLLHQRGLPVVLINGAIEQLDFARVSCDDLVAVNLALNHVASLGHTRIGLLLGPADHVPSERKLAAARAWFGQRGLTLDESLVVHSQYSLEAGQATANRLIEGGATAVVAASDPLALGAVRAARRAGLSVPRDLSVVGFDDSALMNLTDPALTTVRQPIEPMGRAAVDILAALVAGEDVPHDELLFEPELVVRGSTTVVPRASAVAS
ncbi:transcriptional regulator, LacI family [Xylanimonas cellulosilytica DSM 15894]|uniref:Transcriptional regulator, LacI family n=1 Tax=Xylanimonas cellulosilytica (strain DSM 15894 / JCM 12276 / CECT 5975 / KCTC 9989 / LMG 20990 / NBRC 107835 / XIL07) TaxID=446471 RepID=D1BTG0_XYLCX|nr:LacI family DNA-binding transcriptional regulator [Xylanimonas cellulosilytica]ACZ29102.1 transcriptional regulator, LacI family [Xylanimonas cellulosilytica DSM 15894]